MRSLIKKTYKYRLYPSSEQKEKFQWISEECRQLYNYFLGIKRERDKNKEKQPTKQEQTNLLLKLKEEKPQLKNIFSQILQNIPYHRVNETWKKYQKQKRTNFKAGYPRFKLKGWYDSFTYPQFGFKLEKGQLELSKIGKVNIRLHSQKTRKLPENIKTLTIIWKNNKHYACFSCQVEPQLLPKTGKVVGIDMGITSFCATSDKKLYDKERKHYKKAEKRIIKTQRTLSRRKKDSQGWKEAKKWLADKWEQFVNQRKHETYQVVNELVKNYDGIAREDLKIKNLLKNHCLAKKITNASWGIFFNLLLSKVEETGKEVVKVNPRNTSQTCSNCGELREPKLKLSQKKFNCFHCGHKENRDINASLNILKKAGEERCGTNLWGAVSMEAVKNHEFSTEKPPSSNS